MVQMEGKYASEKNENLDEYFKDLGVPLIPRKLICSSRPSLEIKKESDEWVITLSTLLKNTVLRFKLGEEYEEHMPGGTLKCVTNLEGNTLVTNSVGPENVKANRVYEFSDEGCTIVYTSDKSSQVAKRYFKRS